MSHRIQEQLNEISFGPYFKDKIVKIYYGKVISFVKRTEASKDFCRLNVLSHREIRDRMKTLNKSSSTVQDGLMNTTRIQLISLLSSDFSVAWMILCSGVVVYICSYDQISEYLNTHTLYDCWYGPIHNLKYHSVFKS